MPVRARKPRAASIAARAEALLAKMTLEEKIGQMTQVSGRHENYEGLIHQGKVGSFLNITDVEVIARYQKIATESRLGVPLLFGFDVIHGMRTIFPIPLGEAASWDLAKIEVSARVAAREAAATGIHWTFAPMVDVARDARWGRIAEGAGEDVFLGSAIARARVRGFQGKDPSDAESVAACAKHFVGYGGAEGGRDYHTVDVSERTLREVYLPPFRAAIDEGCLTLMSSFNELSGVPATACELTLRRILKKEWKFRGFVISDWDSAGETVHHGHAGDRREAAESAIVAGVDMDMPGLTFAAHLAELVRDKRVPMKLVNDAVRRILRVKLAVGAFDRPLPTARRERAVHGRPDHREAALSMARASMVLVKNEGRVLPLAEDVGSVAVVGPLADNPRDSLGTWFAVGRDEDTATVVSAIRAIASPRTTVRYARGCDCTGDRREGFAEAIELARASDVVVAVLGETRDMSGEAHSRADLGLPGSQLDLLKALHATGKPVVLVLMNGRPLALPWESEHVPAILVAWHLGTTAGTAIAEALFGRVNPSGKLPVSFPRSAGHCPIYYNIKASGRPKGSPADFEVGYVDSPMAPIYPFGHGLGYTKFVYDRLSVSPARVSAKGTVRVRARVTNAGDRDGEEIVQLYVRDPVASVTRPVRELKGFRKIALARGEAKTVTFELPVSELAFYDRNMKLVIEPGTIRVWVGTSSAEGLEASFEIFDSRH
jgi:beta-glucosidase